MPPRHVYVHVPFCARRCAYCDFAIAVRREVPVDEYVASVERELELRFPERTPWPVDTIYLGGGTPSLLGPEGIARLIDVLRRRMEPETGAEVTLEANPENVSVDAVHAWRSAGVNRVSLGAQTFDDRALAWMHRVHDARRTREAAAALAAGGIDDWSIDLIFALPESLGRDWEADVRDALALSPTHVSLYGLTVEHSTPLGRWAARGEVHDAPEERYESEILLAHEMLGAAGFEHYEVSNYARPGHRARHNSCYWLGAPYVGLGPGAHEYDGRERRWNEGAYARWAERLAAGHDPVAGRETLDEGNRAAEDVYLGLRTTGGLELHPGECEVVAPWVREGWAVYDAGRLRLSPTGWLRLDSLAAALTAVRSR